jgi:hypothetical protein
MDVVVRVDAVVKYYMGETWCDVERFAPDARPCGKCKGGRPDALEFRARVRMSARSRGGPAATSSREHWPFERPQDTETRQEVSE